VRLARNDETAIAEDRERGAEDREIEQL